MLSSSNWPINSSFHGIHGNIYHTLYDSRESISFAVITHIIRINIISNSAVKSKNKMFVVFCVNGFGNQQEIIQVLCTEICRQYYL